MTSDDTITNAAVALRGSGNGKTDCFSELNPSSK